MHMRLWCIGQIDRELNFFSKLGGPDALVGWGETRETGQKEPARPRYPGQVFFLNILNSTRKANPRASQF